MAQFKWGYANGNGPHVWAAHFNSAQGSHQSPINISAKKTIHDADLTQTPLHINYSANLSGATMINTGASVNINCQNILSQLSGGPLAPNSLYTPLQYHLHWGSDNRWGSEHLIDGQASAAELHLVHWNKSLFETPTKAAEDNQQRGLCVLGVFLKAGKHNDALDPFISQIGEVDTCGKQHSLEKINLRSLLPENIENYWTYAGSLTTPPCSESVTWIVFQEVCEISKSQLKALRTLHQSDCRASACIEDNFRPPVPLGDRILRSSFALESAQDD